MDIGKVVTVVLYILASLALGWATLSDIRTRKIPFVAGIGLLLIGLFFLIKERMWLEALFFAVVVWGSRGGIWYLLIAAVAIIVLVNNPVSLPFVLGMLFVLFIFVMGWFGGGDSQVAFGLIAIARDWWMVGYLFGGTIVVAIVLSIVKRGGIKDAAERLWWVSRHMKEAPDEEALRTPWAVLASAAGLIYIWLWPGVVCGGG